MCIMESRGAVNSSARARHRRLMGDFVSKETVGCVGGKVRHEGKLSTARSIR